MVRNNIYSHMELESRILKILRQLYAVPPKMRTDEQAAAILTYEDMADHHRRLRRISGQMTFIRIN